MTELTIHELPTGVLEAYYEAHADDDGCITTETVWDVLDELSERGYAMEVPA